MQVITETDINAPIDTVIHFAQPSMFPQWMPGPVDYKQTGGEPTIIGSTFHLTGEYSFDGTVLSWDPPSSLVFELDSPQIHIKTTASFSELDAKRTHYKLEQIFTFKHMPGEPEASVASDIKQRQTKDVELFRKFVESQA